MTVIAWFKIDDGLHSSRKIHSIPKRVRWAALGVWTIAGSWSADQLTDGYIPNYMLQQWGTPPAAPEALVAAGLWEATPDGYMFCNWLTYQPSKAQVESKQTASKLRMRRIRGVHNPEEPLEQAEEEEMFARTNANSVEGVRDPDPTRPDRSTSKEVDARPEVEELCKKLADAVEANGAKRPSKSKASYEAARLLLDKDGYTVDQVVWMINWATRHEFWRAVVLSMPKLRSKFDQMKLQAMDGKSKSAVTFSGDIDADAVLGKDYWVVPAPPAGLTIPEEIAWKKARRAEHEQERQELARRKVAADE